MLEDEIISRLKQNMGAWCVLETSVPRARRIFVRVSKKCLKDMILFLKNEGFAHLSAITGLEVNGTIELLYHLNREGIVLTVCARAENLFKLLREFDEEKVDIIIADRITSTGLGLAVLNRLRRVAGSNIIKA